ncbi:hypothetical protein BDV59DRAFT_209811 [Aspergillus ambiguus]|uniref:uncharacterized protein n=1 Tax=Aspergillus ambiguus TaxID=176160 RepID=UPI003CCE4486
MSNPSTTPAARLAPGFENESLPGKFVTIVFISLALYSATELVLIILWSFRRHRSVYFWSILLSATLGVIPCSVGALLDIYHAGPKWLMLTFQIVGFYFMVPGQSLVLYSRLHIVFWNVRLRKALGFSALIGTILLVIPVTVLFYGSAYFRGTWSHGYDYIERVQLIYFSVQEGLISAIFVAVTIKLIRLNPVQDKRRVRILYELVVINVIAVLLDIALLLLEFLGFYYLQVITKAMVYSIKLKLECAVLGRLTLAVGQPRPPTIYNGLLPLGEVVHGSS